MRKVLKCAMSEGKIYVEIFALAPKVPDGAHVRALIVSEIVPLSVCERDIPHWHTHGRYRDIRGKVIAFEPTDFDGRLLCLMWETKAVTWACLWFVLGNPAPEIFYADPLQHLFSQFIHSVRNHVVFEPRKR